MTEIKSIETIGPSADKILKLHMVYLNRVDHLNKRERKMYCDYMSSLGKTRWIVDPSKINISDMAGPGDIIRKY